MPQAPYAAAAQAAAADAAARVTPPIAMAYAATRGVTSAYDRCEIHPGVRWYGDRPCFVCEPGAWVDAAWLQTYGPEANTTDGVNATVREMVESGHWPPTEETPCPTAPTPSTS